MNGWCSGSQMDCAGCKLVESHKINHDDIHLVTLGPNLPRSCWNSLLENNRANQTRMMAFNFDDSFQFLTRIQPKNSTYFYRVKPNIQREGNSFSFTKSNISLREILIRWGKRQLRSGMELTTLFFHVLQSTWNNFFRWNLKINRILCFQNVSLIFVSNTQIIKNLYKY